MQLLCLYNFFLQNGWHKVKVAQTYKIDLFEGFFGGKSIVI